MEAAQRRIRIAVYRRRPAQGSARTDYEAFDEGSGLTFSNVLEVRAVPRIGLCLILDASTIVEDVLDRADEEAD